MVKTEDSKDADLAGKEEGGQASQSQEALDPTSLEVIEDVAEEKELLLRTVSYSSSTCWFCKNTYISIIVTAFSV